jgi:small subunit ribosomal protein S6
MLNQYETVFILTPVLSEAQVKETVDKFRDFLKKNGAEIVHEENWGLKKLAYPIQRKTTGFYQLFEYKGPNDLVLKFEIQLRRDERIIRFLTVKMDKFAIEFSKKKRSIKSEKKAEEV